jgi:uncharacterized RDD family membrane protein YckC
VVRSSDLPIDSDPAVDPYAPPRSDLHRGLEQAAPGAEPASRSSRLAAVSLDGLLISIPLLPGLGFGLYQAVKIQAAAQDMGLQEGELPDFGHQEGMMIAVAVMLLGLLAGLGIAVYQWILISRTGQSLGKRWSRIRIERMDGGRVTFGTGVVLRNWVPKVMGAVPYLGMLFQLIDALYIFRADRRCLHDHIAGTRVVQHRR